MDPVEAYISLISTVIEQPPEIVRGWLNTYYVLRVIGDHAARYADILPDTEENDHA